MAVSKHFFDIEEDQFDFHSYCIRKMTLRAYIEMLRMVRLLDDTSCLAVSVHLAKCLLQDAADCGCPVKVTVLINRLAAE